MWMPDVQQQHHTILLRLVPNLMVVRVVENQDFALSIQRVIIIIMVTVVMTITIIEEQKEKGQKVQALQLLLLLPLLIVVRIRGEENEQYAGAICALETFPYPPAHNSNPTNHHKCYISFANI